MLGIEDKKSFVKFRLQRITDLQSWWQPARAQTAGHAPAWTTVAGGRARGSQSTTPPGAGSPALLYALREGAGPPGQVEVVGFDEGKRMRIMREGFRNWPQVWNMVEEYHGKAESIFLAGWPH